MRRRRWSPRSTRAGRRASARGARAPYRGTTSSVYARRARSPACPRARATGPDVRVLLVSANQERSPDPVAPLGACYVATAAAGAGHEVQVLDLCFSEDPPAAVRAAVAAHRPEAIGISLRNVDNCAYPDTVSYLPHYRAVVQACRTASEAPIVLGGSAFTTMPAHYLATLGVPFGVVGEGEVAFVELLACLDRRREPRGLPGIAMRHATGAIEVAANAWLPSVDLV